MRLSGIVAGWHLGSVFIEEYRFRSDDVALVKFEGIETAERARMLTNVEVYFLKIHG